MTAFTQASNTSIKNNLIASSVCGLVGLLAIPPLPPLTLASEDREDEVVVLLEEREGVVKVPGKALV